MEQNFHKCLILCRVVMSSGYNRFNLNSLTIIVAVFLKLMLFSLLDQ